MITLRDYQAKIAHKAVEKLKELHIVYLAMEVRTGKTLTALEVAHLYGAKSVLFLTKKRAIASIESDYRNAGYTYKLTVINNESLHKVDGECDLLISDEHHRNGAFPKPNVTTKLMRQRFMHLPMIFLSGTPTPETFSQIYHQFWVSKYSPFHEYANFYKWSKRFVNVRNRHLGYAIVKDYSEAKKELIDPVIEPYMITYSQQDAGFESVVEEKCIYVEMQPITYELCQKIKKDGVVEGRGDAIVAETAVKKMQKLHQLYSGTVILESGRALVFDLSKAQKIYEYFGDKKIGIFYKFKAEYDALKQVYGDRLTNDLDEFNKTDKNIALQIVSGREGISLKNAEYLVYYNIDFSAVSYWQSRDRLTTMNRKNNTIFWIFSKNGIEEKIYSVVQQKKDFTLYYFKKLC